MKYLQKRKKLHSALSTLDKIALSEGINQEDVALKVIATRRKEIENYIASHNIMPAANLPELAVQATILHEGKIHQKMGRGVSNYTEAENSVFQDEADLQDGGISVSNMDGSLLGSVLSAGKAGIEAVNKKRTEKGTKPFFQGKFWKNLNDKVTSKIKVGTSQTGGVNVSIDPGQPKTDKPQTEIGAAIEAAKNKIIEDQKKQFLKDHTLEIVLAIIVLIASGYYLHKHQ